MAKKCFYKDLELILWIEICLKCQNFTKTAQKTSGKPNSSQNSINFQYWGVLGVKNEKKKKFHRGGQKDMGPRTWQVTFPLDDTNECTVGKYGTGGIPAPWHLEGNDLTIPKWYNTWYFSINMPHIHCIKVKVSILAKSALWEPKSTPTSEIDSNSGFLSSKTPPKFIGHLVMDHWWVLGEKIGKKKFYPKKLRWNTVIWPIYNMHKIYIIDGTWYRM